MFFNLESRKPKQEARARAEFEIVEAVIERLDEKIAEFDRTGVELASTHRQRAREFLDRSKGGATDKELERITRELNRIESRMALNDKKTDDFFSVRELILDFAMYIEAFIDFEWYADVIKVIPEKKLPNMVNREDQLDKLSELITVIIEKIEHKMIRRLKSEEAFQREKAKILKRAEMMKSDYQKNKPSVSTSVEDKRKQLEEMYGESELVKPVSAAAANTNAAENHNHA